MIIRSTRCLMPVPGRKGSLMSNGYIPFEKNIQANIQAIDVLSLLWRSSLLHFVIIVVRDDSQDNGCCSSLFLHPTSFSTFSALEETAAITDGAEEMYSSESSCRLTANLVIRRYHSVNES